jgi:hypothetical protein
MRNRVFLLITIVALGLSGCTRQESDSAAREAGRTAHDLANKTEKAAKKVGREIEKAAKDVREGWKEGDREDKTKPRR